jgi:hypothetical protein
MQMQKKEKPCVLIPFRTPVNANWIRQSRVDTSEILLLLVVSGSCQGSQGSDFFGIQHN